MHTYNGQHIVWCILSKKGDHHDVDVDDDYDEKEDKKKKKQSTLVVCGYCERMIKLSTLPNWIGNG